MNRFGRLLRRLAGYILCGCLALSGLPCCAGADLAIVIGVNRNQHRRDADLRWAVADSELIVKSLIEGGFPERDIVRIADNSQDGSEFPMLAHIQRELRERLPKMQKQDRLILFFSGHAAIVQGQWIFVPFDFDRDNALATSLNFSELRDLLAACPAERKLLLLDCCRSPLQLSKSGEPSKSAGPEVAPALEAEEQKLPLAEVFKDADAVVIAGCRPGLKSFESDALGHGFFAFGVAEALRGQANHPVGDAMQDAWVDTMELRTWIPTRVRQLALKYGYDQEPVVSDELAPFQVTAVSATAESGLMTEAAENEHGEGRFVLLRWGLLLSIPLLVVWFLSGLRGRPRTVRNVGRDRHVVD
jgi:uncharacterized caspase-like protein